MRPVVRMIDAGSRFFYPRVPGAPFEWETSPIAAPLRRTKIISRKYCFHPRNPSKISIRSYKIQRQEESDENGDVFFRSEGSGARPGDLGDGREGGAAERRGGGAAARPRSRPDPDRHRGDVRRGGRRNGRRRGDRRAPRRSLSRQQNLSAPCEPARNGGRLRAEPQAAAD